MPQPVDDDGAVHDGTGLPACVVGVLQGGALLAVHETALSLTRL